jgi:putative aminopeptidase FrvX
MSRLYYSHDWKENWGDTKIGKGPVVTYAPAVQNNLRELILDTAEERNPFQRLPLLALPADTDAFAYSNGGVASALISLPLRYMHTGWNGA